MALSTQTKFLLAGLIIVIGLVIVYISVLSSAPPAPPATKSNTGSATTGTGTVTGSIGTANPPAVTLTAAPVPCNDSVPWSSYFFKGDSLSLGGILEACTGIKSPDGKHVFVVQPNGNLSVINQSTANPTSIWTAPKLTANGIAPYHAEFQASDGNFVLYDANRVPISSSDTFGKGATRMTMQNDGNDVLYTAAGVPVWATNTDGK